MRLATTSLGLTCAPFQIYSLVEGPRGLIPDQCQAGTRSGALDAQVQVAQRLLQSGGVCRLRVRDQAKALHKAPDHSRKQHDLPGPGFIIPGLSQQWQDHFVVLNLLRYRTGHAVLDLGNQLLSWNGVRALNYPTPGTRVLVTGWWSV